MADANSDPNPPGPVTIKSEVDENDFTDAETIMNTSGFLDEDVNSSETVPVSCGGCSLLMKSQQHMCSQVEVLLKSLELSREANSDLKISLEEYKAQNSNMTIEIATLKATVTLLRNQVETQIIPQSQQPNAYDSATSMSSNISPSKTQHIPTHSGFSYHGIDAARINVGYYCICGVRYYTEAALYSHLKHVTTIASKSSQSNLPAVANPSRSFLLCCKCKTTFEDWNAFRYHTYIAHGIVDLEIFEKHSQSTPYHNSTHLTSQGTIYGQFHQ